MPGVLCPSCGRGAPGDAVSCPACGALLPVAERGEPFPMAAELASALGPHYRVESLLGSGGYAHVFRVHDQRLDRHLAAKVLLWPRPSFETKPIGTTQSNTAGSRNQRQASSARAGWRGVSPGGLRRDSTSRPQVWLVTAPPAATTVWPYVP